MDIVGIDKIMVDRVGRVLRGKAPELLSLNVFDEKYYPPKNDEIENVLRYFIVMVAMDHRLSRPGRQYYACLEDGCYKGADLLYRLGMRKYLENHEFFSPQKLSTITVEEVSRAFSVKEVSPPDIEVRTLLLRDLGIKLTKLYDSSVTKLLINSNNRIRGSLFEPGLVDNLKFFRAYEDPVEKKSMLFAKFIIARGYFKPVDQPDVAVDNHLSRIAYRLGLVMVSGTLWDKIKNEVEFTPEEDILLRLTIRRAYRYISEKAKLSPINVDDFFWIMGRTICLRDSSPLCDKCFFKGFCKARKHSAFMVKEHVFYNTWYY
ncbi:MAG: iron-sulfur cluster loop [Desulfurococcaceae archaeon]